MAGVYEELLRRCEAGDAGESPCGASGVGRHGMGGREAGGEAGRGEGRAGWGGAINRRPDAWGIARHSDIC